MKTILLVLFALTLVGCAGSFEEARAPSLKISAPPPSERCIDLDDARATWSASAKGSAILAGASGIATIPVEDDTATAVIVGAGIGLGAFAAFSGVMADAKGNAWARECADAR